jgi:hypothetical protein
VLSISAIIAALAAGSRQRTGSASRRAASARDGIEPSGAVTVPMRTRG